MRLPVTLAVVIAALAAFQMEPANANVVISSSPTKNMSCSGVTCTPTKPNAVLNSTDLENLLAEHDVKITTANALASNIVMAVAITLVNRETLELDAYKSVTINAPLSDTGTGGVLVLTNTNGAGGVLSFGPKGQIQMWNLNDLLTINGTRYTLVANVAGLATAAAANPSGFYALANNYNAAADGTYTHSPVTVTLQGTIEGLGNTITNLFITDNTSGHAVGLVGMTGLHATVADLRLKDAKIRGGASTFVGAIVANDDGGTLRGDSVNGFVRGGNNSEVGALAYGVVDGSVANCSADATVEGGANAIIGGLIANAGEQTTITDSYSRGLVSGGATSQVGGLIGSAIGGPLTINATFSSATVTGGNDAWAGGLVGTNGELSNITNSLATGTVTVGNTIVQGAIAGGLVGISGGTITASYAIGVVTGGPSSYTGGLIGTDGTQANTNTYWDTSTSGITNLSQGAASPANDPGITGLTTAQLQAGLPAGFAGPTWLQSTSVFGDLPYLAGLPVP